MSYTRAAPTRTDVEKMDIRCNCPGTRKATRRQAGPSSKNPGRWFYTCPLGKDDPGKCNFFKWEDELGERMNIAEVKSPRTPSKGSGAGQGQGQGQSQGRALGGRELGDWFSPSKRNPGLNAAAGRGIVDTLAASKPATTTTPQTAENELDWEHIDVDALEKDAEARTPHKTPQSSLEQTSENGARIGANAGTPASRLGERLQAMAKRKAEDDGDRTPKRTHSNPFIETPKSGATFPTTPGSVDGERPPHPALAPVHASLEGLSEHLARQDRLVRAAETMKKSMRATIHNLQERVKELEAEVEELKRR